MSEIRILCNYTLDEYPEAKNILDSAGLVDYGNYSYNELKNVLGGYEVLIPSLKFVLDRNFLKKAERLQLIATPSTGTDHIDIKSAGELNIQVISLKGEYEFLQNVTATAEHAFALLFSVIRKIPFAFEHVKQGMWNSDCFRGHELSGKVFGIIGYGRLGEMVSQYAHAFGMYVLAYDPYRKINVLRVKQVELNTLLEESDIISVHVHLNEETKGFISRKEFSIMKKGVFIINTSRGAVIDENAFVESLGNGTIKAAGIDVLAGELTGETSGSALVEYARTHTNLIITPHIGGVTFESQKKAFVFTAQKVKEFLLGTKE